MSVIYLDSSTKILLSDSVPKECVVKLGISSKLLNHQGDYAFHSITSQSMHDDKENQYIERVALKDYHKQHQDTQKEDISNELYEKRHKKQQLLEIKEKKRYNEVLRHKQYTFNECMRHCREETKEKIYVNEKMLYYGQEFVLLETMPEPHMLEKEAEYFKKHITVYEPESTTFLPTLYPWFIGEPCFLDHNTLFKQWITQNSISFTL